MPENDYKEEKAVAIIKLIDGLGFKTIEEIFQMVREKIGSVDDTQPNPAKKESYIG